MGTSAWLTTRPAEHLVGDGLVLQRNHVDFAVDTAAAVRESLVELAQWMPWAVDDYGTEQALSFVSESDSGWGDGQVLNYVILLPGVPTTVAGTVGFINRLRPGWLEIGYWVRTVSTGQHLARRATELLVQAARDHLPEVVGVEIHHDEANLASGTVPAALGFTRDRVIDVPVDCSATTGRNVVWTLHL